MAEAVQATRDVPPTAVPDVAHVPSASAKEMPSSVLVVDDQPDVLETLADLLGILGFDVFSADSGEAALRVLRETPGIEVLLTDVVMPRMNGVTLAHQALRLEPDIKVILVSGYASPELHSAIAQHEEFRFLAKPFKIADLARILRQ